MSKIKLLLDVVDSLQSLAESLQTLADAMEQPEEEKTVEEQKESELRQYKLEDVRRALSAKSAAGKTVQVKELLLHHGASKLSAIDPSEYPAMIEEAEDL